MVGKVVGVAPFDFNHLLLNRMDGDVHIEANKKLYRCLMEMAFVASPL